MYVVYVDSIQFFTYDDSLNYTPAMAERIMFCINRGIGGMEKPESKRAESESATENQKKKSRWHELTGSYGGEKGSGGGQWKWFTLLFIYCLPTRLKRSDEQKKWERKK